MDAYEIIMELYKEGGYPLYKELKKTRKYLPRDGVNLVFNYLEETAVRIFDELNTPDCWRIAICGALSVMTQTEVQQLQKELKEKTA